MPLRWSWAAPITGECLRRAGSPSPRVHHIWLSSSKSFCVRAELRSTQVVEMEYAELNLREKYGAADLGHIRIRQHVNPLSSSFSMPMELPDWNSVFRNPQLPLMVDIGCVLQLVQRSQFWVKDLCLDNIYFLFANATTSFERLVSTYPGSLALVSILCPDPHFKRRHHKRRVLQKPLVDSISKNLAIGGQVFVQSDVYEVAVDMREQFDALSDSLVHVDILDPSFSCDPEGWLLHNPMGIRTEREIHAELEGAKVYRRMYKKQKCCTDLSSFTKFSRSFFQKE